MSGYNPNDFSAKRAEETQPVDAAPITHADEASAKWAAAHNYRVRCEIELTEATARHQQARDNESEAWNALEVAAGRAPQAAMPVGSLRGVGYRRAD